MVLFMMKPVFKEAIWGGKKLRDSFHYEIPSAKTGECWAISGHKSGEGSILGGTYDGMKLSALWKEKPELFGHYPGSQFPLLVKIIDAQQDLSIQVHPDDAYAAEHENGSLGKTECWYVLDCEPGTEIVIGHYARDKKEMEEMIRSHNWEKFIRRVPVKKGDFFQIDPGCLHAIKGGTLILETQQSSDITYRLYDYGRMVDGKPRELHLDKSMDVITVPAKDVANSVKNTDSLPANTMNELESNQYYTVWKIDVDKEFDLEQEYPFMNMSVIEGDGLVNGQMVKKGDHFVLPAGFGKVELRGGMRLIASAAKS